MVMLNVVILAAGMGKRMQSDLPKVLHALSGKTMLDHVLQTASQLEPGKVVVVVGHGAQQVRNCFAERPGLAFAEQSPQLGTGHAVQQAIPLLDENSNGVTLILYGDVPLVQPDTLKRLLKVRANGLALLTENLADPSGYGRIVRDSSGKVVSIVEHKDANPQQLEITEVNTGILAAPTAALKQWLARINNNNAQGEYYLTDIISLAVADGISINTANPKYGWETLGVNTRQQQAQLERAWQAEQANRLMDQGVTLADPSRLDVRGSLECGRDVFIDVGCVFEGNVQLADGAHIGPHCVIKNTTIGAGAKIEAFSHLDNAVVGNTATVGPYARLRPGSALGNGAHIGNFVEIKNSVFGANSKASHLAYIGDATIGNRVNIGAGTITCNYDGVNKNQTIIEDDAFIGSDTQLVAPVRVEKGATIGAGTTLTETAPEGRLTLSRVQQKTIFGWTRPRPKS